VLLRIAPVPPIRCADDFPVTPRALSASSLLNTGTPGSVTVKMERFTTIKPIWQGVISAGITVTTGLLVLAVYYLLA